MPVQLALKAPVGFSAIGHPCGGFFVSHSLYSEAQRMTVLFTKLFSESC